MGTSTNGYGVDHILIPMMEIDRAKERFRFTYSPFLPFSFLKCLCAIQTCLSSCLYFSLSSGVISRHKSTDVKDNKHINRQERRQTKTPKKIIESARIRCLHEQDPRRRHTFSRQNIWLLSVATDAESHKLGIHKIIKYNNELQHIFPLQLPPPFFSQGNKQRRLIQRVMCTSIPAGNIQYKPFFIANPLDNYFRFCVLEYFGYACVCVYGCIFML